jgi:hypoxanthine phosphoribosyltransferase
MNKEQLDHIIEQMQARISHDKAMAALLQSHAAQDQQMLDLIHQKDYFTIARDVKKSRFRPYMMQFLKFANEADELLCKTIRQQNVLVIDDVTTSGSTLNEILRTLRILNEDNNITIFSLIGRKDLIAESV